MKEELNFEFKFNYFLVIASLEQTETTKTLYDKRIKPFALSKNVSHKYVEINSKAEMIDIFNVIINNHQAIYPFIYFATHGDKDGLILNKDEISWEELSKYLLQININCKNHLTLIFASCFGVYGFKLCNYSTRAPYYMLIGPTDEPMSYILDNVIMDIFLQEFFKEFNFHAASNHLKKQRGGIKSPMKIHTCAELFLRFLEIELDSIESGKKRHEILAIIKEQLEGVVPDEIKSEFRYKEQLEELSISGFEEFKNEFFMIDIYPENYERFEFIKRKSYLQQ